MYFLGQAGPHHPQPEALPVAGPLTESCPSAEMMGPRTGHVTQAGPIRSFPGRAQGKLGEQVSPCQGPPAGRQAYGTLRPCPPCPGVPTSRDTWGGEAGDTDPHPRAYILSPEALSSFLRHVSTLPGARNQVRIGSVCLHCFVSVFCHLPLGLSPQCPFSHVSL